MIVVLGILCVAIDGWQAIPFAAVLQQIDDAAEHDLKWDLASAGFRV